MAKGINKLSQDKIAERMAMGAVFGLSVGVVVGILFLDNTGIGIGAGLIIGPLVAFIYSVVFKNNK